jgi:small conductance mechanosensitive channel
MESILNVIQSINFIDMEQVSKVGIRFVLSIGIFALAAVISGAVKSIIKRALTAGKRLMGENADTVVSLTASVFKYVIFFIALCFILDMWGINVSSILALGGVASLSIGIGAQDAIKDMLAGLNIITDNHFAVGDYVSIEGLSGKVESIGLRLTCVRGMNGDLYIIPNGKIGIVTNMSKGFNRANVEVSIAYKEDVDRVIGVLEDEMKTIAQGELITGLIGVPTVLGITELGDSGVVLKLIADCEIGENWRIERELRRYIKNRLDREGIEIPFPQQVVYVREEK